jgi:hypothetical protein
MRHAELRRHGSQRQVGDAVFEYVLHGSREEFGSSVLVAQRPTVDLGCSGGHIDEH